MSMWCPSLNIYIFWYVYKFIIKRLSKKNEEIFFNLFHTLVVANASLTVLQQLHTLAQILYFVFYIHDMFSAGIHSNQIENYMAEAEWQKKGNRNFIIRTNCVVFVLSRDWIVHWKVQIANDCRSMKIKWTLQKLFILYITQIYVFVSIHSDKLITVLVSKFLIYFAWFLESHINRYTSHGFPSTVFYNTILPDTYIAPCVAT
jgi:hypothetical protein